MSSSTIWSVFQSKKEEEYEETFYFYKKSHFVFFAVGRLLSRWRYVYCVIHFSFFVSFFAFRTKWPLIFETSSVSFFSLALKCIDF